MIDLENATHALYEELITYLQNAPVNIQEEIHYDTLYQLCFDEVVARLSAAAEARVDAQREKDLDV